VDQIFSQGDQGQIGSNKQKTGGVDMAHFFPPPVPLFSKTTSFSILQIAAEVQGPQQTDDAYAKGAIRHGILIFASACPL